MAHIPYGYDVRDGKAVVNKEKAETVREIYRLYLEGETLKSAAKKAGYEKTHSSISNILKNERYLGDDFYPRIIDDDLFQKVSDERTKRATKLGRIRKSTNAPAFPRKTYSFRIKKKDEVFTDPFKQAEYIYENIEVEVTNG